MAVGSISPLKWDPFGFGKRRRADEKAKAAVTAELKEFEGLETGLGMPQAQNLYADMENVYEDQTIDQRAAQFAGQQFEKSQANIMQGMQGAGGFDISNIQALAGAGATQAQQSAASIGTQEQANQARMLGESSRIQGLERQGLGQAQDINRQMAMREQDLTWQKQQGILAAKTGQAQAAATARQQGVQNLISGVSAVGGIVGSVTSDRKLKKNISLIGKSPNGLNIYSFEYRNTKYGDGLFQGVMSDEVPQETVMVVDGHDMVDYSMLDVEFKRI